MDKKILIIDDEPDIREAIAEALTDAGFIVFSAENGEVGVEKALAEKPDVILLDIVMPVLDGHAALKKIRQDSWGQSVKVIMLTSMDDVHNVGDAHELNITDYLIKPHSSLAEIVKKVREYAIS
jgi:DNA-binding response OmpR family regulator